MKIYAISDLHGMLPDPDTIPPCDLLVIAGDVCPVTNHDLWFQEEWLTTTYKEWVGSLRARTVAWTAGNHDFALEKPSRGLLEALPGYYLQDTPLVVGGGGEAIAIYGTPWTPTFYNWAFMRSEDDLAALYEFMPYSLDILISHGPPRGVCDKNHDGFMCGSKALRQAIEDKRPKVVVCGHIHEARGMDFISCPPMRAVTTQVYNVSQVNLNYQPVHGAVEIVL